MDARLVGRGTGEGINHNHLVVARTDGHAHAVVLAALVFAHQRIGFRIEEIRVRIEGVQHAGDRALIDGLVRVHRLGVVILDKRVDVRELFQAVLDLGVAGNRRLLAGTLGKQNSQEAAGKQKKNHQEKGAAGTTVHLEIFFVGGGFSPSYGAELNKYITSLDWPGPGKSPLVTPRKKV